MSEISNNNAGKNHSNENNPNARKARQLPLVDADATVELGHRLGEGLRPGMVIYLQGTLGAGKTTLTRGILRAFNYSGTVKSPTYTLVEPYQLTGVTLYHFDLYRLGDAEELEFLGIRDYFSASSICLVEWPQRGEGYLAAPDLIVSLAVKGLQREATLQAVSMSGQQLIEDLT